MTLWVIKIGTSLIKDSTTNTTNRIIYELCSSISNSKKLGDKVVLVSSGAVGLGCSELGIKNRPNDLASLQAVAAIGQSHLMRIYEKQMANFGYKVAQVLLTRSDLNTQNSYRNASLTLQKLLEWNVLPIVNENDTLSDEELRYGDNDTLSALVATAINADQLILLTDVDKLYSSDPKYDSNAIPITDVHVLNDLSLVSKNSTHKGDWGTGGIRTKLAAAKIATSSGITVHLADGRDSKLISEILRGSRGGTVFHPSPEPIKSKKSWLAHALKPLGKIYLDEGACEAIQHKGASLLLVGVKKVDGIFKSNQAVQILNLQEKELARGLCSMSSEDLREALHQNNCQKKSQVIIHRDVLVLTTDIGK